MEQTLTQIKEPVCDKRRTARTRGGRYGADAVCGGRDSTIGMLKNRKCLRKRQGTVTIRRLLKAEAQGAQERQESAGENVTADATANEAAGNAAASKTAGDTAAAGGQASTNAAGTSAETQAQSTASADGNLTAAQTQSDGNDYQERSGGEYTPERQQRSADRRRRCICHRDITMCRRETALRESAGKYIRRRQCWTSSARSTVLRMKMPSTPVSG